MLPAKNTRYRTIPVNVDLEEVIVNRQVASYARSSEGVSDIGRAQIAARDHVALDRELKLHDRPKYEIEGDRKVLELAC